MSDYGIPRDGLSGHWVLFAHCLCRLALLSSSFVKEILVACLDSSVDLQEQRAG